MVLSLGLIAYIYFSTPNCKRCGAKVKWSNDKLCEDCKAEDREREQEQREQFTEQLVAAVAAGTGDSKTCPNCRGASVGPPGRGARTAFAARFAFTSRQCQDCQHVWLVPRSAPVLLAVTAFAGFAAFVEALLLLWWTIAVFDDLARVIQNDELKMVAGSFVIGLSIFGFTCWVLNYAVRALRAGTRRTQS